MSKHRHARKATFGRGWRALASAVPLFLIFAALIVVPPVAIAEEVERCAVIRESVHDLLSGPVGSWVLGHVEVDDAPTMVSKHDENEQDA